MSSHRRTKLPNARVPPSSRCQPNFESNALLKLFIVKPPKRPYRGTLRKAIVRASSLELLLRDGRERQEYRVRLENSRVLVEQLQKLFLLLDHFEIPKNARDRWFCLAFGLARQHVPGMKIVDGPRPKTGPKGKWRETQLSADLILAVVAVKREPRTWRGAADAIRLLRKRHPTTWGRFKEASLRTRYYEALKEFEPYRRDTLLESLAAWLLPDEPST